MSRLASNLIALLAVLAIGCVVEATDPNGNPITGGDDPDASSSGGGADADPGAPDAGPTGGADADETPTAMSVLTDFGNCMTLADWDAAGLGQLALVETQADGNCAACHSAGQNGNYLNADSTLTFNNIKTYPYVQRYATVDAQLNLSASQDLVLQGQAAGHPQYTLPAALIQGITDFFDATNARYIAGNCPPAL